MNTMTAGHLTHSGHRHSVLNPLAWMVEALATHRQRLHLAELDAHLLEDIGIDAATQRRESRRAFWDLPR